MCVYALYFHVALFGVVFEVLDPLDYVFAPGENTRTNPNTVKYNLEVGIDVLDSNEQLFSTKRCHPQIYVTGSSVDFKKELCEFKNVYGEYVARILTIASKIGSKDQICTGIIDIPLSRLEPNVVVSISMKCTFFKCIYIISAIQVSQYYQLNNPDTYNKSALKGHALSPSRSKSMSFLRTAIRLEVIILSSAYCLLPELY